MRYVFTAATLGSLLLGCSARTACDDATDKLMGCGLPSDDSGSCDDAQEECEAKCVLNHDCDEIRAGVAGTPNALTSCVEACV